MTKVSVIIPSRNERFLGPTVDAPYGFIYLITNKINGKQYVGQTSSSISKRWTNHLYAASKGFEYPICQAIRKHKEYNFNVEEVAEAISLDQLNKLESLYIESYNTIKPNGYNLDSGGDNFIRHPDTGRKISEAKKGKPSSRKGVKMSEETKRKLSKAKMGQPAWNKGIPRSNETKAKLSAAKKGKPGTPHTAEFKQKLSASLIGNQRARGCKRSAEYKAEKRAFAEKRQRDAKGRFIKDG